MINNQLIHGKVKMINKKTTMLKDKQGNAIIVSLLVTMLVVVVMFSVVKCTALKILITIMTKK